jgi:Immune inhibitor A peptidase M6
MAACAVTALGVLTIGAAGAGAGNGEIARISIKSLKTEASLGRDTTHVGPDVRIMRAAPKAKGSRALVRKVLRRNERLLRRAGKYRLAAHTPVVGEIRRWQAIDFEFGFRYGKNFQYRGGGNNVEIWVAADSQPAPVALAPPVGISTGTNFIDGDCRNGVRTTITNDQVAYLINEFDTNIYPKESTAFSVPPNRDGTGGFAPDARYHPQGDGDNIVVLVDNVRDDNFYDVNNTQGLTYVAGFFSSTLNDLFNRNIMTIDAFDWLHRTGANPAHEPSSDLCTSAPARPNLYESVFAHEYQHLLEAYASPGEQTWVNEGLSDWAQTLTGYAHPDRPITEIGFDSHIQCFLGYLGIVTNANPIGRIGGPENSLTSWSDQGDDEILCDYGAAYTNMEYVHGQFGTPFMKRLHNEDLNGFSGYQAALNAHGGGTSTRDVLHRWAMTVAIDGLLDQGRKLRGGVASLYQTPTMNATVNWDNPDAFSEPGAPPNGSDYLRLKDAAGHPVKLNDIKSLHFNGASRHTPHPVEWTVDTVSPPASAANPALYSGIADNMDRTIVRQVSVPAGGGNLTFDAFWNTEDGWDFAFVQVSTDGGASYQSIACTDTVNEDPAHPFPAIPAIKSQLPGFHAYSNGWRPQTCSLAAYAGRSIHLAFRHMTDTNTQGSEDPAAAGVRPGFWVDNVAVAGTAVSDGSTLAGWQSLTQVRPIPIEGFTVQLLAYKQQGTSPVRIARLPLNSNFDATLNARQLARLLGQGNNADVVAAIVMYDESTESIADYAPYTLTVTTNH